MAETLSTTWPPVNAQKLGRQFTRLGWLGFWIQLALLAVPVLLLAYVLIFRTPESARQMGIDLSNYLSYGSLLVMVFITFWFYRYTRLGRRIAAPERCPPRASVERTLWVGLWASCLGILFSMLLMLAAVGRLLFVLLANPQTGVIIAPGPGGDPVQSISAIDALSLTTLLVILVAELSVLGFSLWLLFRTTRSSTEKAGKEA